MVTGPIDDTAPGAPVRPGDAPGWTAAEARRTAEARAATGTDTESEPRVDPQARVDEPDRPDAQPGRHGKSGRRRKKRSPLHNVIEWALVIVGAIAVAFLVKTFLFQAFWIPSPSMSPTLVKGDRVLVNKLSYRLHDVNRGDVIVFERPPTETVSPIKDLIKRVVAVEGDRVSIRDGKVFRNGKALDEPYTNGLPTTYSSCGTGDVTGIDTEAGLTIPEGEVFVMGDNRVNSHDGRCFGPIDEDLIVGRAFFIIWPPGKMGGL